MIVGLCGLARSGKDSFFEFSENFIFNENPNIRLAFADELKKELDNFLRGSFGIGSFSDNDKEKDIIRPILVAYGMQKRVVSNGLYWINKIEQEIKRFENEYNFFITDVRFPNEVSKIKDLGGKCIYIEREGNKPPNKEEEENDPIVRGMCDYHFKWKNFCDFNSSNPEKLVIKFLKGNKL